MITEIKSLLQMWWEDRYPNAGVKNVLHVSEGVLSVEHLVDFENWLKEKNLINDNDPNYNSCGTRDNYN